MEKSLVVHALNVRYKSIAAVRDVSFKLLPGEILALTGSNGSGKSSTVMSLVGGNVEAEITGSVKYGETELLGLTPEAISNMGIACVPEGRRIFTNLTVLENLIVSLRSRVRSTSSREGLEAVFERFPALKQFRTKAAGLLSGGQMQQLALARALLRDPDLLVVDEPSIGLAPKLVTETLNEILRLRDEGIAILLVEQNSQRAIAMADHWIELSKGRITSQSSELNTERS